MTRSDQGEPGRKSASLTFTGWRVAALAPDSSTPLVNYAVGLALYDHSGNLGGALGGMMPGKALARPDIDLRGISTSVWQKDKLL
jgi:hypothetical protein